MGKADTAAKNYTEDPNIFADIFNYRLYGGKPVIDPERLHSLDAAVIGVPYGSEGAEIPVQKYRDMLKYVTSMEDDSCIYLLLGLENQNYINYAMPVKDMVYDALQYAAQVEKAAASRRKEREDRGKASGKTGSTLEKHPEAYDEMTAGPGAAENIFDEKQKFHSNIYQKMNVYPEEEEISDPEERGREKNIQKSSNVQKEENSIRIKVNSGEYLTGFSKEDKLIPVITLVLHFSAEKWDGPMSLHEMLAVQDPGILAFVPDYRINLISPAEMTDAEIDRMKTSLREVLKFIKYSNDKKKLGSLLKSNPRFQSMERKAVRVIEAATGKKLKFDEEDTTVNVSKALADMEEDAKREGIEEGKKEGIEEGIKEGSILNQISYFRKMSGKRMQASEISEILDEPFEFVENVLRCIQNHPGWDDKRILNEIQKRSGAGV